jgi:UDP-glucose 4-epimerase
MKVFLTGGTGFIGSHIAIMLIDDGHQVVILARNPEKVPGFIDHPQITFVKGSTDDLYTVNAALQGCETAIHVALSWGHEATSMLMNETFSSVNIAEAAAHAGVKHFIFTSSEMAFGDQTQYRDESLLPRPNEFYGASKAATENFVMAIGSVYNMRANVVRPGSTFDRPAVTGAPFKNIPVKADLIEKLKRGETVVMSPNEAFEWTSARNVARVYQAIMNSDRDREIYLAIDANRMRKYPIIQEAIKVLSSSSKIEFTEEEKPVQNNFNCHKIEEHFGLVLNSWEHMKEGVRFMVSKYA